MTQGVHYRALVADRLGAEQDRRQRLDDRSSAVTTSSAALLSLIVALIALVKGNEFQVGATVGVFVVIAVIAFAFASGFAMTAGMLRLYKVPTANTFETMLGTRWKDSEPSQLLACAWMDLDTLLSTREVNNAKAWWLDLALRVQLGAFVSLSLAAVVAVVDP